ncbi:hypothetical protein [Nonomuraea sp. NEAU-A123]|uniref:hypothetical protein n=1 Tax=Nonomuraea sp. NEAU-A123 TaxID=2839649 RepID=UPI001BE47F21|nr:hypothetical protein [Nonomuraea sp. NEAU-A123]MBT2233208.1 hypothetical protein [Nonomuraea sp. NEAU-A123]
MLDQVLRDRAGHPQADLHAARAKGVLEGKVRLPEHEPLPGGPEQSDEIAPKRLCARHIGHRWREDLHTPRAPYEGAVAKAYDTGADEDADYVSAEQRCGK